MCHPSKPVTRPRVTGASWDLRQEVKQANQLAMDEEKKFYVYIITNKPQGVLYIGVTNDLVRRMAEHGSGAIRGFSWKYNLRRLVYVEIYDDPVTAISREKQLKAWERAWKIELIEQHNADWIDLATTL